MTERPELPSPSAPNYAQRVRETLMTYLGVQGDPLNRGVTLRDLIDNGFATLSAGWRPGGSGVPSLKPGSAVVSSEVDLTPPPTPEGFTLSAAISHVFIECSAPVYTQGHGHLRTRVYGVTHTAGTALPTFSNAIELGQFGGQVWAMPSNPATTWRLWIKWESLDGVLSTEPAGGTNGLAATTGQNVALLLEALQGQITESQLYQTLGDRINLVDGNGAGSVNARLLAEATALRAAIQTGLLAEAIARGAAIQTEQTVRQTADSSLSQQLTTLTASVSAADVNFAAAIQTEATTRANAVAAEAQARQTLAATVNGNTTAIQTEQTARQTADSSLSQQLTTLTASVSAADVNLAAAIQTEATTRANAVAAEAKARQTLAATVNGNTTAIQTEQTVRADADGRLFAQYTIKIDINGYVSGYGLASTAVNGIPESVFGIRADRFFIANPGGPGITPAMPFIVQTTPTTINGVAVPAGVYMRDAFIQNGTITTAKIADLAVDDAKIASLSVNKITSGSISVGTVIKSGNYSFGVQGWQISGNGNAEFNNITVRGTVYANLGSIGGIYIDNDGIYSRNQYYSGGGTGFAISKDGRFYFGNNYSALKFDGTVLTYSGQLNVVSSSGSDRLEIKNDVIKVFSGGVLRVKIGNLNA